jgi:hypothetical protein
LLSKASYLFSIGFLNWSPHSHVDPQPIAMAGYYYGRHEFIAGATHADFRNEALLGYAYDFNETWRVSSRLAKRLRQCVNDRNCMEHHS